MVVGLPKRWSFLGFFIAFLFLTPLLALLATAAFPDGEVFAHLADTVLPTYILNTLLLMLGVGLLSALLAIPAAWLVARCEVPGRRFFQWALLLPLAMPAYVVAYVYTDLLDYPGPIQRAVRALLGIDAGADYWFPDIRSLGGATLILAFVLFPYIFLLARTAFMEQSLSLLQASRLMGASERESFWRLALPMARPAIAAGVALVAMETAADFATVSYFAVPTLTTAVYDTWLGYGSLASASKLSMIILVAVFLLIWLERFARRRQQLFQRQALTGQIPRLRLGRWRWLGLGYCSLLLFLSFLLPLAILLGYAVRYFDLSWQGDFWRYSWSSFSLSAIAAVLCVVFALVLLFIARISPRAQDAMPARLASTGYALPGTVLAIGVLGPLTWLDFGLNDFCAWLGIDGPGLLFTGSTIALIFAFCVRFIAIAIGGIENSWRRLSPSLDMAALSMGRGPVGLFFKVHLPLLRTGILASLLLVFIEAMKELPAALLLRPIGFENLATKVFEYVSDERLEQGALGAIVIVLVGLIPLVFLNRSIEKES
ncbi:iron ABC transporter permease [Shewanella amazonensis]|uniref:Iron(III) ABC transporter, permease protein n=1 Tax=Shewanella amazonensis (strain ATCC BAA-1098 / SB2B) TaxID=326297 RepID=A1S3B9_SHEAM|nr:iron ABC transporter permease [Shewanella amazonensis]ABL98875.1 iron(III) ABC transporter, permease protein [Shewanella amazonensis SB2B]